MTFRKFPKLQFRYLALTLALGLVHFGILWWNHFSTRDALIDGGHTFFALSIVGLVLYVIQFSFHTKASMTFSQFGLIATLAFLIHYSALYFLKPILDPDYYEHFVYNLQGLRYTIILITLVAISLFWWIAKNAEIQEKIRKQLIEQERALSKAELVNINNQLQPHFLFNSLNSISALTMIEPKEANRMIHLLSDFLRGTLKKDMEKLVSLKDELNQANLFLEIEKIRFGNRLIIDLSSDIQCDEKKIPPLLIQPLVENALKHGLNTSSNTIDIKITCKLVENSLHITIENPYDENNVPQFKGTGYGIQSVKKRLQLFYGQTDRLRIERENGIFKVTLQIPQIHESTNN